MKANIKNILRTSAKTTVTKKKKLLQGKLAEGMTQSQQNGD